MINLLINLLFPVYCLGCGKETHREFICPTCFSQIPLSKKPPLKLNSGSGLTGLVAASYYAHPLIKKAIHNYKYDFIKDLAEPLGCLLVQRINVLSDFIIQRNSILIPVPLHKKRLRWRGFNQSELLALEISRQLNIPIVNNLIVRKKYNLPQAQIQNARQRKQNIKNAFMLNKGQSLKLRPFTAILIDDIATTGATLGECARVLKPLKPKEIWGLVIARR
jgi:competence protein ComFC